MLTKEEIKKHLEEDENWQPEETAAEEELNIYYEVLRDRQIEEGTLPKAVAGGDDFEDLGRLSLGKDPFDEEFDAHGEPDNDETFDDDNDY